MSEDARQVAATILQHLQDTWNAGDGIALGEPFAEDVDFVDIRGDHHRGREAVAHGHQAIFDTIYKGSTITYELVSARQLADEVILAHSRALMRAPAGPLAGENRAVQTLVLTRTGGDWRVAAFQNTLVAPPPSARPPGSG